MDVPIDFMIKKALKSPSKYKVCAIAFDKKGDILGIANNTYSTLGPDKSDKFMGFHAERRLMERYKSNIKTIIVLRAGKSGILRPISPCKECQERAKELGIKIISIKGEQWKPQQKNHRNQNNSW